MVAGQHRSPASPMPVRLGLGEPGPQVEAVDLSAEHIRKRLSLEPPADDAGDGPRAAVAAILRFDGPTRVLLIRRSEQPGDPWSGHMALPGGRMDPEDTSLLGTAIRETSEEVGIDLGAHARLMGQLDGLGAMARGEWIDLVIVPFVFALERDLPLRLNDEVDEALWAPLEPMAEGAVDTIRPYRHRGETWNLPAFQVGPHVVWGLTYRMLSAFFELLR